MVSTNNASDLLLRAINNAIHEKVVDESEKHIKKVVAEFESDLRKRIAEVVLSTQSFYRVHTRDQELVITVLNNRGKSDEK